MLLLAGIGAAGRFTLNAAAGGWMRLVVGPSVRNTFAQGAGVADETRHLVLTVEIPAMYVDDVDELREFAPPEASESDHILNCIGEPSIVKLRTEIHGEKASDVVDVYGLVREASLQPASRGYVSSEPALTDDQLRERGHRLEPEPDDAISDAVRAMRAAGVPDQEIRDELAWWLVRFRG